MGYNLLKLFEAAASNVAPPSDNFQEDPSYVHPYKLFGCADERLSLAWLLATIGRFMIDPSDFFCRRMIGGRFDISQPDIASHFARLREKLARGGEPPCVFATYHGSQSNRQLNCAGNNYDTNRARAAAQRFAGQIRRTFPAKSGLDIIVMAVETDLGSIGLHFGETFISCEQLAREAPGIESDSESLYQIVRTSSPGLSSKNTGRVARLLASNIHRVRRRMAKADRKSPTNHTGAIIVIGQGSELVTARAQDKRLASLVVDRAGWRTGFPIAVKIATANLRARRTASPPEEGGCVISFIPYGGLFYSGLDHKGASDEAKRLLDGAIRKLGRDTRPLFSASAAYVIGPHRRPVLIEQRI